MNPEVWPAAEDYARVAEQAPAMLVARGVEARVVGSYATGTHVVPYSDIDMVAVAAPGDGARVRDIVGEVARAVPGTICVAIDPFGHEAILYSILERGLQIDWFVAERDAGGREQPVWRGERPLPDGTACRAWSSLLYTIGLLLKGGPRARELSAYDLAEHWTWLAACGIDVSSLPARVPAPDDDLLALIAATADAAPPHAALEALVRGRLADVRGSGWSVGG